MRTIEKPKRPLAQINCSLFSRHAEKIDALTQSIYSSQSLLEKLESAQELLRVTKVLFSCPKYDRKTEDCFQCNFSLNLRREMAKLIVDAAQTAS